MAGVEALTAAGSVIGRREGSEESTVHVWRGIPYAAPPVGALRWRSPAPVEPWDAPRDALRHGPRSWQAPRGPWARYAEDCLTINVTAPAAPSASGGLRPVLVFVHGGANTMGAGSEPLYAGRTLVARGDLVLVTFNYRLGVLGFLDLSRFSTSARVIEGNLAVRDQIAALRWVRDNIAAFGGDPTRVTLSGESAGGIAVTTLLATPAARGLFHRALAQSPAPGAANPARYVHEWAGRFAELLGASPADVPGALDAATPQALVAAGGRLLAEARAERPGCLPVGPTIDGELIPEHPLDVLIRGEGHPVPLLTGTNAREGALFVRWADAVPTRADDLERLFAATDPGARERVVAAYPGYPARDAAAQLGGDRSFLAPTALAAAGHAAVAPTWVYRYDHAPRLVRSVGLAAAHATELPAVFYEPGSPLVRLMTAAGGRRAFARTAERVQRRWSAFVHGGAPGDDWPRYTPDERATLIIDDVDRVEPDPDAAARRAWEGFTDYR